MSTLVSIFMAVILNILPSNEQEKEKEISSPPVENLDAHTKANEFRDYLINSEEIGVQHQNNICSDLCRTAFNQIKKMNS